MDIRDFASILPPQVFGLDWRSPIPFYFLSLVVAVLSYALVLYLSRSTFGIALQGIRDNARRMRALGFHVTRTASQPTRLPGSSPRSAAFCWSGSTAGSRGNRRYRPDFRHPDHRRARGHAASDRPVFGVR